MSGRTAIALFTRDLRVHDNPVLTAAHSESDAVVPLFVLDEAIARSGFIAPNRARFLSEALADLDAQLARLGGRLILRRGRVVDEVLHVAEECAAEAVHIAGDVSGYAHNRERALRERLAAAGRELHVHAASVTAAEPGAVTPSGKDKDHFAVFTPYFRRWSDAPLRGVLRGPRRIVVPDVAAQQLPRGDELCTGRPAPRLPAGGESTGRKLLEHWLDGPIEHYHDRHDDLAADATSRISPYLHFGCLSVTEVVGRASREHTDGRAAFVRQLAWRDFHHQVLAARADAAHADYRPRGDRWHREDDAVQAWREGRTGYPLVDAGMRQLLAEGWMHNRARLVTASFLTKTLYADWRIGAAHFLEHLVDADVANNQLNWQWVAGTGTDTRPNRVLNPVRQAERYDPDGDYVRRWIPELADVPTADIHTPWKLTARERGDYPQPIVDLRAAAQAFRAARDGGTTRASPADAAARPPASDAGTGDRSR